MSHRYRLYPALGQEPGLERHCADARKGTWLAEGSSSVQQKALRDFDQALANLRGRTHGRPRWRKKGEHEGFRIRDVTVHKLNRQCATVTVPKVGPVRLRLSRPVPATFGMARVTLDASGRLHVSFVAAQAAVERTPTGSAVGIDRGATTVAVSDGTMLRSPSSPKLVAMVVRLDQRLSRQQRGSKRRARTVRQRARTHARIADRRRDWVEKTTTRLVVDHDILVLENLRVKDMARRPKPKADPATPGAFRPNGAAAKAALNRSIQRSCWSTFARRPTPRRQGDSQRRHRPSRRWDTGQALTTGLPAQVRLCGRGNLLGQSRREASTDSGIPGPQPWGGCQDWFVDSMPGRTQDSAELVPRRSALLGDAMLGRGPRCMAIVLPNRHGIDVPDRLRASISC